MSSPMTQWQLSEFDRHSKRLADVSTKVAVAGQHLNEALGSNGNAFGMLFGWAVAPGLDALCGNVQDFSHDLHDAINASATGIMEARTAYDLTEHDNIDRSKQVEAALEAEQQRVK